MNGKKCFKCGSVKNRTEFYRHPMMADGLLGKCKDCTKKDVAEHRAKNIERVREYDRERARLPHRREKNALVSSRWRRAHPLRYAAHVIWNNEVRKGGVQVLPCLICGRKAEAHHPDYSRPLDVVWLCSSHHKQAHAIARRR